MASRSKWLVGVPPAGSPARQATAGLPKLRLGQPEAPRGRMDLHAGRLDMEALETAWAHFASLNCISVRTGLTIT